MAINPLIMFLIPLLMAVMIHPDANLPAAILVATAFCAAQAVVYAFLASTMPRNGGDYYFQSRLLSGGIGAVFAFTPIVLGGVMWMAIAGWIAANVVFGPAFEVAGRLTSLTACLSIATAIQSRTGVFTLSIVTIAWSAIVAVRGLDFYGRLQRVFFFVGIGSTALLIPFVFLAERLTSGPAFAQAAAEAVRLGWTPQADMGLRGIIALVPLPAFALIYCAWSVQQSGEVRGSGSLRTQLVSILGAVLMAGTSAAGMAWLVLSRYDPRDLGAVAFLFLRHPEHLPVGALPFYWVNLTHFWPGGAAALLLIIALNSWFWMWAPNTTLAASRIIVAMSSDRLLPRVLAETSPRNGTPVRAIVVFSALCTAPAALYAYTSFSRLALDATMIDVVAFAVTCGIAASFPFIKRELYRESSASPYEVLGIPLISLAGATFVAFALFVVGRYFADPGLALGIGPYFSHVLVGMLYAVSLGLYLARRRYRRAREGAEVELLYDQPTGS